MINTAMGVRSIRSEYLNVGRVLQLSPFKTLSKIMIPATLPYMFTGYRLSLGMAWLVIVAAEMLTGTPGRGRFPLAGIQQPRLLAYPPVRHHHRAHRLCSRPADERGRATFQNRVRHAMAYLEIKGVGKSYRRNATGASADSARLAVLSDINLAIDENEFVCIVGRSGSGKTTLISLIAGLLEPDRGEILLDGQVDRRAGSRPRRSVSKLFLAALDERFRKRLSRC